MRVATIPSGVVPRVNMQDCIRKKQSKINDYQNSLKSRHGLAGRSSESRTTLCSRCGMPELTGYVTKKHTRPSYAHYGVQFPTGTPCIDVEHVQELQHNPVSEYPAHTLP